MRRRITQREQRSNRGRIMRALDKGESFTVTRNGVPVAELVPVTPRAFVSAATVVASFRGAPRVDAPRFRRDVDASLSQDATPRGGAPSGAPTGRHIPRDRSGPRRP